MATQREVDIAERKRKRAEELDKMSVTAFRTVMRQAGVSPKFRKGTQQHEIKGPVRQMLTAEILQAETEQGKFNNPDEKPVATVSPGIKPPITGQMLRQKGPPRRITAEPARASSVSRPAPKPSTKKPPEPIAEMVARLVALEVQRVIGERVRTAKSDAGDIAGVDYLKEGFGVFNRQEALAREQLVKRLEQLESGLVTPAPVEDHPVLVDHSDAIAELRTRVDQLRQRPTIVQPAQAAAASTVSEDQLGATDSFQNQVDEILDSFRKQMVIVHGQLGALSEESGSLEATFAQMRQEVEAAKESLNDMKDSLAEDAQVQHNRIEQALTQLHQARKGLADAETACWEAVEAAYSVGAKV